MASKTLTLNEASNNDRDTFILSNQADTNYDANGLLSVGKSLDNSTAHRRILIYRNILADFPVGVIFDSAFLELYFDGTIHGTGSGVAWVNKITDPSNWVESEVTYNQRKNAFPSGLLWGTAGGDLASSPAPVSFDLPVFSGAGYVPSNDMASLFKDAIDNESGNLGLIYKKDVETTGNQRYANFSDSGQAGQEPRFVVNYHVPVQKQQRLDYGGRRLRSVHSLATARYLYYWSRRLAALGLEDRQPRPKRLIAMG